MKTNLKGIAFLLLPICIVLGCKSTKPTDPARSNGQPTEVIYIGGQFKHPGIYPWTNGMTLQDGIAAAGGFSKYAHGQFSIRHSDNSRDFYRYRRGEPLPCNPALEPGDSIIMPQR